MTSKEKSIICEIMGFSKALQISKPSDDQSQKMFEEIDKRLSELLGSSEGPEKKIIEEHHYHHYNSYPVRYGNWSEIVDNMKLTCSDSSTVNCSVISSSNICL